jgi:hypothetical protein
MIRSLLKGSEYSEPESLIANFYVLILTVFRNLGKSAETIRENQYIFSSS